MPRATALPLALLTALPLVAAGVLAPTAHAAGPGFSTKAVQITVNVAPEGLLKTKSCLVDADLYTPTGVDAAHPAPAILATNGFGGSKADQAGLGKAFAAKGYVVLSYSGLGFGSSLQGGSRGSGCKITLDDREHDGAAASQLIDYLAGLKKDTDGNSVNYVERDKGKGHDGKVHAGDIRIGMTGGSYGGEIQFATAAVDPRLDTIVPLITWNDLAYSLAPNNTSLPNSTSVTYKTPGTEKIDWTTLFFGVGFLDGIMATVVTQDPTRPAPCTNFADQACLSKVQLDSTGYPDKATLDFARHASVESYIDKIHIPTLLGQGQADTLFTLHEATATYASLKARKVAVKMIWQQWGHSHAPVAGEFDLSHPDTNYEGRVITAWFDHYLMDRGPAPSLDFTYYRDWLDKGNAAPAFTSVPRYPIPGTTTLYGSGSSLIRDAKAIQPGSSTIATGPQAPTSYTETSGLDQRLPVTDAPLSTTALSTAPLTSDVDVVGIPTATLRLASPTAQQSQTFAPAGQLVAFIKLYDVAPDGTITLPHRVISPIRIADVTKPVQVSLPGIVHRFPKGHVMKLVVSLSDAAYKNNALAQVVTLSTSKTAPTTLTLPGKLNLPNADMTPGPVDGHTGSGPGIGSSASSDGSGSNGSRSSLASTGLPAGLPVAAAGLLVLAGIARRRRTA